MSYPYTEKNRLDSPHYYMYTQYEGEAFVESWYQNRIESLNGMPEEVWSWLNPALNLSLLGTKIKDAKFKEDQGVAASLLPAIQGLLKKIYGQESLQWVRTEDLLSKDSVDTKDLLKNMAIEFLFSGPEFNENNAVILLTLLKKYEVFKRLFSRYNSQLKKESEDYKTLEPYLWLSFNLLIHNQKKENLIFLNTGTKLNDLLISVPRTSLTPQDLSVWALCLFMELHSIFRLGVKNEVFV